ncbi:MAG: hypothetical protein H6814_00025 [Phycisphaeraceae bacterium]|nr:hypothetical protein [Phycisphaeraceae bacterium]
MPRLSIPSLPRPLVVARALLLLTLGAVLTGCGAGYQLRGKVIEGEISFIAVVSSDDPRLDGPGIPGVSIRLVSDPNKLNKEMLGEAVSGGDGSFSIGVDRVGAGFFNYDAGVSADRKGFEHAESQFNLPPSDRRVLVILRPGINRGPGEDDAMSDYEKFR